ncbi:structural maintenance of chromosomes protein 2 [Ostrinia nubilalis]|uniref:structural maintenance of chromosomes protein 2 n=1 Tax=Ostrinia nubilalis TaxID=29057 RepID=UPI00308221FA
MHIKSIVLDGFKSYGNRVEVTGFDPEFNAITGLNGTGKSNILDSICFVLGITNLSNVRAGSLQELIYKHGQAGITKATVSITFDNRDKRQCPIGYENHDEITVTRQVVMGGKNKYLINGINVQNKRVSDLFCSVQLNVNNPHFLIMQGRITKVLNMKPPEILSMVEEAAGTRMYEAKKQAAQKTIEKKDAKLRELNDIIREDIAPKLQKLQDERSQFQEYQKVVRELENLTRLYVAWKYVSAEKSAKEAEAKVTEVQDDIKSKKENIKHNEKEAKDLDKQVVELNKKLDEESGSVLKDLEIELQVHEKTEASASAGFKAAKDALASHEKKARLLSRALADDEAALGAKRTVLSEVSSTFENLRAASEASETALAEAQQKFLAVSTGLEGASESLQDQLMAAKAAASEASTRITQSTMEREHAQKRLKALEREFQTNSAQYQRDQDAIRSHSAQVEKLQGELSKMNFSEERNTQLKESTRSLQGLIRSKRDVVDNLSARLQRCDFKYSPPQPNFDSRRVSGTICRLIDVCDPVYCTALETAAGGRLYNVVVDTEVTSKLLLQRGNLQTRTTIIPLNKISGHVIDAQTVRRAQEIGGGPENVQLALDLIKFEPHLRPAMAWVFGGTLVCRDLDTAKRVTFHRDVRRRCVTLDGDVFDPSGTLSGGARAKTAKRVTFQRDVRRRCVTLDGDVFDPSGTLSGGARAKGPPVVRGPPVKNHYSRRPWRRCDTAKRVTFHRDVRRRCVTLDGDVFDPSGTLSGGARAKTAKRVTFHRDVRRRCVTLDGDVFDPSGTLSGGARAKGGSVLVQLQELKEAEAQLQQAEAQYQQCSAELASTQHAAEKYAHTQQRYEMMSHELEVIKARLATTSHAQTHAEIESLRAQVEELSAAVERDKVTQKETAAKARELEAKVKDIKGHREREFKKAEAELKKAKKEAEQHSSSWKQREQEFETLRLEVTELEQAVASSKQTLQETVEAAVGLQESLQDAKEEHTKATREQEFETLRLEVTELEQAVATSKQTLQETVEAAVGLQESLQDAKEEHTKATREQEFETLRLEVTELEQAVASSKQTLQETVEAAVGLQESLQDAKEEHTKATREQEFETLRLEVTELEQAVASSKQTLQETVEAAVGLQESFSGSRSLKLRLEVTELEQAVASSKQTLQETVEAAVGLQESLQDAKEEHTKATEAVKEIQSRIKKQKLEIASRSSDISRLHQKKEQLGKSNAELELKIKELDYKIKELQGEAAECAKRIKSLEAEHTWIPSEREYFGAAGGLYDFAARQASVAGQRLQQLADRRDKLARGLNARAHTLLGKEEEQYQDVMRKKKIVEADRAKLVQVMAELDEKKKKTLVTACEQVNKDFGSIFSTLLPGAQARLKPPDGLTVLDGLEVKVGFNNTWKESLGELSGGQRSLVALSLVLAMLLFKPAPLYILDEVDAALDLSHTQNIGHMLKQHFTHSQFIIVSLKDGMFNNANVLFRTKFVDGMSSVQRTVNSRR